MSALAQNEPLRVAAAIVDGKVPVSPALGGAVAFNPGFEEELGWSSLVYAPEAEIEYCSRTEMRSGLVSTPKQSAFSYQEEHAIHHSTDDRECAEILERVYTEAANETVEAMMRLAQDQSLPYRLRARLCAACREELAALVDAYEELQELKEISKC